MKIEGGAFDFHGSMRIAAHDLRLDALYVVYPGMHRYRLADGIEAVPLWALLPPSPVPQGAAGALQGGWA